MRCLRRGHRFAEFPIQDFVVHKVTLSLEPSKDQATYTIVRVSIRDPTRQIREKTVACI